MYKYLPGEGQQPGSVQWHHMDSIDKLCLSERELLLILPVLVTL